MKRKVVIQDEGVVFQVDVSPEKEVLLFNITSKSGSKETQ